MVGTPAEKKSTFTTAASMPARQQSENTDPRLFGFIFRRCPPISNIFPIFWVGPATTENLVVKFGGEICGGVLVENASDDFPRQKKSQKISFKTSPEVRRQCRRKLRQLHSGIAGAYLSSALKRHLLKRHLTLSEIILNEECFSWSCCSVEGVVNIRQETGALNQSFWSRYLPVGWRSSMWRGSVAICAKARCTKSPETTSHPKFSWKTRCRPEIPQNSHCILSAILNSPEFSRNFPNFPECAQTPQKTQRIQGNQGRRGIRAISQGSERIKRAPNWGPPFRVTFRPQTPGGGKQ